jgi:hypothetical protein
MDPTRGQDPGGPRARRGLARDDHECAHDARADDTSAADDETVSRLIARIVVASEALASSAGRLP